MNSSKTYLVLLHTRKLNRICKLWLFFMSHIRSIELITIPFFGSEQKKENSSFSIFPENIFEKALYESEKITFSFVKNTKINKKETMEHLLNFKSCSLIAPAYNTLSSSNRLSNGFFFDFVQSKEILNEIIRIKGIPKKLVIIVDKLPQKLGYDYYCREKNIKTKILSNNLQSAFPKIHQSLKFCAHFFIDIFKSMTKKSQFKNNKSLTDVLFFISSEKIKYRIENIIDKCKKKKLDISFAGHDLKKASRSSFDFKNIQTKPLEELRLFTFLFKIWAIFLKTPKLKVNDLKNEEHQRILDFVWPHLKTTFVTEVLYFIARSCNKWYYCVRKLKPKIVILTSRTAVGSCMSASAKALHVPTLLLQLTNEPSPEKLGQRIYPADHIAVWGENDYKNYSKIIGGGKIHLVGSYFCDEVKNRLFLSKNDLFKKLGINWNKKSKIILFISSYVAPNFSKQKKEECLKELCEAAKKLKLKLIIKTHPLEKNPEFYEQFVSKYLLKEQFSIISERVYFLDLVDACKILIHLDSTAAWYAVLLKKHMINLQLGFGSLSPFDYNQTKYGYTVKDIKHLTETIDKIIKSKRNKPELTGIQITKYLYKLDGKAADRTVELIEKIIEQKY